MAPSTSVLPTLANLSAPAERHRAEREGGDAEAGAAELAVVHARGITTNRPVPAFSVEHPHRLAAQEGGDVLDRLAVEDLVAARADVADVRREHRVAAPSAADGRAAAARRRTRPARRRRSCPRAARSSSASSSTIGPRDVLTSTALGFIAASSRAPISPRVRSLRRRWMVTTSERASSSSLVTGSTPAARAASGSRFWLQARTPISNAWRDLARCARRAGRARSRRACGPPAPARSCAASRRRGRHGPRRRCGAWSRGSSPRPARPSGSPRPPVPHTVTPRSRAASMSIAALAMPVVTSSRRSGSLASRLAVNGVRSRIATTTS